MRKAKSFLFLALDVESRLEALDWVQKSKNYVQAYKIGPRLFLTCGPQLIEEIKNLSSAKIFLDFKFFDIPSSTVEAVRSSFQAGADFVTVHACIGPETLQLLSQTEKNFSKTHQILCVTVLSSVADSEKTQKKIFQMAEWVYQAGLRGLVCSPWELRALRQKYPDMFLVTPGIRLKENDRDDQKRVMTPEKAVKEGSSALVIGRSVLNSKEPVETLKNIYSSL